MPVVTIALFIAFLVLVGDVRVWIQVRRTGDAGDRRRAGWPDPVQRRAAWIGASGGLALGLVSPIAVLAGLNPIVSNSLVEVGGLVLTVLGMVATFAAQQAMGDSWRAGVDPDERTTLVTSGPFRLVRNPILSSLLVTCAGLTFMTPTVVGLAGLCAVVASNELLVRLVEEPYLRRVHGQQYLRYAAAVGRFLPGIGRLE